MTTNMYKDEVVATGRIQASQVPGLQVTLSMFGPKEALHVHAEKVDDEGFVLIVIVNVSPYYVKHMRAVFAAHLREKGALRERYRESLTVLK